LRRRSEVVREGTAPVRSRSADCWLHRDSQSPNSTRRTRAVAAADGVNVTHPATAREAGGVDKSPRSRRNIHGGAQLHGSTADSLFSRCDRRIRPPLSALPPTLRSGQCRQDAQRSAAHRWRIRDQLFNNVGDRVSRDQSSRHHLCAKPFKYYTSYTLTLESATVASQGSESSRIGAFLFGRLP